MQCADLNTGSVAEQFRFPGNDGRTVSAFPPPLGEKPVIVRMRADPEPDDRVGFQCAHGSIIGADPYRVDRQRWMHGLETKTRLLWVFFEDSIRTAGLALNFRRQFGEGLAELRSRARDQSF